MSIHSHLLKAHCFFLLALFSATVNASLSVTYYHNDVTGSPVAATNEAGAVVWRKDYTPYGETNGKDRDNKVGYTGHQEDASGLVYAGARYYDPALGRFLGVDSVGFSESNPMSFNRYSYANNNPYKYVDPDGRLVVPAWSAKNDAKFKSAISELLKSDHGRMLYDKLNTAKDAHGEDIEYRITDRYIKNDAYYNSDNKTISIDPNWAPEAKTTEGDRVIPLSISLGHEMGHAATGIGDTGDDLMDNVRANENKIRLQLGYPERTKYEGKK